MPEDFFDKLEDHSIAKTLIVEKYFKAWATVMKSQIKRYSQHNPTQSLAYIDLYSGPGMDNNGEKSTPIRILEYCTTDEELCKCMKFLFNDADSKNVNLLSKNISNINGIDKLVHKPSLYNSSIDQKFSEQFANINLIPSFSFIDPFGYKGLTKDLIDALVSSWGCDCIFFFNYNRISMGITNPKVIDHIDALFGDELANYLRNNIKSFPKNEKENFIINSFCNIFKQSGKLVLPFRFQSKSKNMTSHYLIFITKHTLGYKIMKNIMANQSTEHTIDGVASFSYIPTSNKQLSILYEFGTPLNQFGDRLLERFSGKTLSVKEIISSTFIDTPFTEKNIKDTLKALEKAGKIQTFPLSTMRRKNTMADTVSVTFPKN